MNSSTLVRPLQLLAMVLLLQGCTAPTKQSTAQPLSRADTEPMLNFYKVDSYGVLVSHEAIELMGVDLKHLSPGAPNPLQRRLIAGEFTQQPQPGEAFSIIRWRANWR